MLERRAFSYYTGRLDSAQACCSRQCLEAMAAASRPWRVAHSCCTQWTACAQSPPAPTAKVADGTGERASSSLRHSACGMQLAQHNIMTLRHTTKSMPPHSHKDNLTCARHASAFHDTQAVRIPCTAPPCPALTHRTPHTKASPARPPIPVSRPRGCWRAPPSAWAPPPATVDQKNLQIGRNVQTERQSPSWHTHWSNTLPRDAWVGTQSMQ